MVLYIKLFMMKTADLSDGIFISHKKLLKNRCQMKIKILLIFFSSFESFAPHEHKIL